MRVSATSLVLIALLLPACSRPPGALPREARRVTVAAPQVQNVTLTERFACGIQAQRQIAVRAVERGELEAVAVREGQEVQQGDVLFKVQSRLHQAKRDADAAERDLAQVQLDYARQRRQENLVTDEQVTVAETRLARAKAQLEATDRNFAAITAPFAGVVGPLRHLPGTPVEKGEVLTTLYDNSLMRAYFKVPESRYLGYSAGRDRLSEDLQIELELSNGTRFPGRGALGAIDAQFDHATGNISFRADFPDPDHLLRHGQTGYVLLSRVQKEATVIPKEAAFDLLDKRYVYVVDSDDVIHRREIVVQNELDDLLVVSAGVSVDDRIVVDGVGYLRDGDRVECQIDPPAPVEN